VILSTPVGDLLATADESGALTGLWWGRTGVGVGDDDGRFAFLRTQLERWFAGEITSFEVPLAPRGTPWQQAVWAALRDVPYGETITYTELAARAGRPGAARAAGAANGRNPISILIPCHRVVGTSGALTGYAGGVDAKAWLLAHERAVRSRAPSPGSPPPRTTGRHALPAA
jgi:methylated-DNA-[protein]-cysteine S-methyltransferase